MARRGQEIELNMEDIEETPIPSEARCWKKRSGHGALRLPGLVNVQKAIEHGHRNSWWLPTNSMVIFHSYVNVYQRVCPINMMVIIAIVIDYGFHNDPSYLWIGEMVMNVVNIFWGCHMFRQTHIIYSYL